MNIQDEVKNLFFKNRLAQLILITIFGLVLRTIGVFTIPLTFDETHNVLLSQSNDLILMVKVAAESYPPLYFLIWHTLQAISDNLIFLRLPSLVFGILTILLATALGKKLFNWKIGLIASLLFAFSPSQIYYSSVARMYALNILEALLIIYFFTKFIKTRSGIVLFGITVLIGLYSNYFFIILFFVLALYFYTHFYADKRIIKQWLLLNGVILFFYLPVVYLFFAAERAFAVPANTILKIPFFFIVPFIPWDIIQTLSIVQIKQFDLSSFFAFVIIFLMMFILFSSVIFTKKNKNIKLFILVYLLSTAIIILISYLIFRIMNLRAFILFSSLLYFIISAFLEKLQVKVRVATIALIIFLNLFFLAVYYTSNLGSKDILSQVYKEFKDNDYVVYNDVVLYLPSKILKPNGTHLLIYPGYFGTNQYKALSITLAKLPRSIKDNSRIWYIKQNTNWPPYETLATKLENDLKKNYTELKRKYYYQFQLILYLSKRNGA